MADKNYYLNDTLNSAASSPTYFPALNNYLYNTQGYERPVDRVPFVIRTIDESGNAVPYTIDEETILGIVLSVNPASITVNMSKMVGRTQTMSGWLEEHWGEDFDTISFQGSTAAFIWQGLPPTLTPPPEPGLNDRNIRDSFNQYAKLPDTGTFNPVSLDINNTSGLATVMRRETASYKEFKKVISLMNANAATFDIRGMVQERFYIEMTYDYACYRGYFENIDTVEDSASPFRFQYTITFKSERTVYRFSGASPLITETKKIPLGMTSNNPYSAIGQTGKIGPTGQTLDQSEAPKTNP